MQDAKRWMAWAGIFTLAVCGLVSILLVTRWGLGSSPDSAAYLAAARNLLAGRGLTVPVAGGGDAVMNFRAPFYSIALALVSLPGIDPLVAARWLNAFLFSANVFLIGYVVHRHQRDAAWLPLLGAAQMSLALPMLEIHAYAWTEPLFIFLGFQAFFLLVMFLRTARWVYFLLTAVFLALTWFTRYAGAPFVAVGSLGIILFSAAPWRKRMSHAFFLGALATLPLLIWSVTNMGAGASATGRQLTFHPAGRAHLWQAVFTLSDWLYVPSQTPGIVRVALLLLLFGLSIGVIYMTMGRKGRSTRQRLVVIWTELPVYHKLLLLFAAIYFSFLLFSISFLDANTPLDTRILSPLYVVLLLLALFVLYQLFFALGQKRRVRGVVMAGVGLFLALSLWRAIGWLNVHHQLGIGFSSVAWQQSALVQEINALPPDTLIFSNSPEAVYLLSQRPAAALPKKVESTTRQFNVNYGADLSAIGERLASERGVVVYFYWLNRVNAPTEEELRIELALRSVARTADGLILSRAD